VYQVLALLTVPAPPRLIVDVHDAVAGDGGLSTGDVVDLLREDELAQRTGAAPSAYPLCPALTAGDLAPVRGLVAVAAWALERRLVGPLSRRVDRLTAAHRCAEHAARLPGASPLVAALLRAFAAEIPGGPEAYDVMRPASVAEAAQASLAGCAAADAAHRAEGARRARATLSDADLLFGAVSTR
jgi:hypothetical protein